MKKRFVSLLLMLITIASLFYAQSRPVVVIVPFEAKDVNQDEVDVISEVFLSEYTSTGRATVVDRNSFDKIAVQQQFQLSDWSDTEKVAELGHALNAHQIITGQISKFSNQLVCSIKCIDVNSTEILFSTVKRVADMNQLFDIAGSMSKELALQASKSVKEYKIGDKGPAGGTVYAVDGDYRWEVSVNLGEYTWEEAFNLYKIGNVRYYDWILPTITDVKLINDSVNKGILQKQGNYWTKTECYVGHKSFVFTKNTEEEHKNSDKLDVCLIRKFNINDDSEQNEPFVGKYKASLPCKNVISSITSPAYTNVRSKLIESPLYNRNLEVYISINNNGEGFIECTFLDINTELIRKGKNSTMGYKSASINKYSQSFSYTIERGEDSKLCIVVRARRFQPHLSPPKKAKFRFK